MYVENVYVTDAMLSLLHLPSNAKPQQSGQRHNGGTMVPEIPFKIGKRKSVAGAGSHSTMIEFSATGGTKEIAKWCVSTAAVGALLA